MTRSQPATFTYADGRPEPRAASPLALLAATRPRQWLKNLLVLGAPTAAGVITRERVIATSALGFVVLTLAAAGTYLLNDVHDAARDRGHPDKRARPVAAGTLGSTTATVVGAVLCLLAPTAAFGADEEELGVVVLGYLVMSLAYTMWLKRLPVVELAALATGFVLRPLAGAAATSVPPSRWFLAVCGLGALTVALGKRSAELARLGPAAVRHRPVLAAYTSAGLGVARRAASAATLACYAGWAVTRPAGETRYAALGSLLVLALALWRYGVCNARGAGDTPEELVTSDRLLLTAAVVWAAVFAVGVGHV